MKLLSTLLAAAALAMSAQASAEVNLLRNGSFEEVQIPSNSTWRIYNSGSTGIPGWTVLGADTQLTRTEFVPAAHGNQWIDLTGIYGYNKGLLSDGFATEAGKRYTVSFDLGDFHAQGFRTATLALTVNNQPRQLFTNIYEGGIMDWERKSYTFTADSNITRLSFLGVENGSLSNNAVIGLDNVVVNAAPVPEAETYAMMLAGLAGLGLLTRRKQNQSI
ncbi:DUF642 domain-containing protein [Massilia sp. W12]|uniref:DUF642 domain-containing protein n=1 Tax=Massilia sp. W12 TaxID=3126507 RepID=UPI0030CE2D6E